MIVLVTIMLVGFETIEHVVEPLDAVETEEADVMTEVCIALVSGLHSMVV